MDTRFLIWSNATTWVLLSPHAKFIYNKAPSKINRMSPNKVTYEVDPLCPLDVMLRAMNEKPSVEANKRL